MSLTVDTAFTKYMRDYVNLDKKLLQAVALLQWGHNLLIINKKLTDEETYYYARKSVSQNWNRDLLFSNRKLNCLVAIDLKIGEFKSEYVGKMNMYLSLLDKLEKEETENQSIGIILCAEKDHLDVELALQDINKPIAVSDYELLVPKNELQTLILNEMKQVQITDNDEAEK